MPKYTAIIMLNHYVIIHCIANHDVACWFIILSVHVSVITVGILHLGKKCWRKLTKY